MNDEMRSRRKREDTSAGLARHDRRTENKNTCVRETLFRDWCAGLYLIVSLTICRRAPERADVFPFFFFFFFSMITLALTLLIELSAQERFIIS